jgi:hypothetical protein
LAAHSLFKERSVCPSHRLINVIRGETVDCTSDGDEPSNVSQHSEPPGTLDSQNLIPVERVVAIAVRGREGLGERSNNHWQRKELKKSQWKRDQNQTDSWEKGREK